MAMKTLIVIGGESGPPWLTAHVVYDCRDQTGQTVYAWSEIEYYIR